MDINTAYTAYRCTDCSEVNEYMTFANFTAEHPRRCPCGSTNMERATKADAVAARWPTGHAV